MQDFDPYLNDYEMFGAIDPEFNSIVPTLASIYLVIFGIALLFGIAYYIMYGIALLRMAKRAGVKHGWLGFVPIADNWLLAPPPQRRASARLCHRDRMQRHLLSDRARFHVCPSHRR